MNHNVSLQDLQIAVEAVKVIKATLNESPRTTPTELATHTAIALDHKEWLEDPDHWIWNMANDFME